MDANVNSINWFEISVADLDRAQKFYETIFDIKMERMDMPDMPMSMFPSNPGSGKVNGGLVQSEMHKPSADGVKIYLNGDPDLQSALDKVTDAGGQIIMPKTDIGQGFGFMAFFIDTEGNVIATYVSGKNDCTFCQLSHGAAAAHHLKASLEEIEHIKKHPQDAPIISEKLKALLQIAGKVQISGKSVTQEDIDLAKSLNATDKEIHDTVLIAATFCMYNRYVDGLNTWADKDPESYKDASKRMAEEGYLRKDNMVLMSKE